MQVDWAARSKPERRRDRDAPSDSPPSNEAPKQEGRLTSAPVQLCVNGCELPARSLGRCSGCYAYLRRHGHDRDVHKAERRRLRRNARRLDDELEADLIRTLVADARRRVNAAPA